MLDERTLSEIYSLHSRGLYWYIYRMIRSQETAEDILHDTFVKLINFSRGNPVDMRHLKGLIYKIAHNTTLNHIKRRSLVKFSALNDNMQHRNDRDFTDQIEQDELNAKISELLGEVDEKGRSLYLMKKEQNLTYDEIAEITGMPERTVRRRISNIVAAMGKKLAELGFVEKLMIILTVFLN